MDLDLKFTGERSMVTLHEDIAIDETSQSTTNERSNPVDPVVVEVAAGDGWPERASRIHGPTGEWAGGQDVGSNNEPNGNGGNGAQ